MTAFSPAPPAPQIHHRAPRTALGLVLLALVSVLMAGCSAHASIHIGGSATITHPDQLVSDGLLKSVGTRPKAVSCPSDVPAKTGHVFTCRVTINSAGDYVIATVTETSVSGTQATVHISDSTTIYKP